MSSILRSVYLFFPLAHINHNVVSNVLYVYLGSPQSLTVESILTHLFSIQRKFRGKENLTSLVLNRLTILVLGGRSPLGYGKISGNKKRETYKGGRWSLVMGVHYLRMSDQFEVVSIVNSQVQEVTVISLQTRLTYHSDRIT